MSSTLMFAMRSIGGRFLHDKDADGCSERDHAAEHPDRDIAKLVVEQAAHRRGNRDADLRSGVANGYECALNARRNKLSRQRLQRALTKCESEACGEEGREQSYSPAQTRYQKQH